MKKSMTILAIILIALVAMMGSVNAASITANPATAKKISVGDTVTVTVTTKKDDAIQFNMTYPEGFEYVSTKASDGMALEVNTKTAGALKVVAYGAQGDTVTMTFKATKEIAPEATQEIKKDFVASKLILGNEDDSFTNGTATVTVKGEEETPTPEETPSVEPTTTPEDPSGANPGTTTGGTTDGTETGTTTGAATNESGEKVGTDGNVIKKLPQTGAPVFAGAGIVAAIALAVVAGRKIRK